MLNLKKDLPTVDNYKDIILNDQPLIDVRAALEFARGSLPSAVNLPLLNDEERAQVGKVYKQNGQNAAVALGLKLVSGDIKKQRISAWQNYIAAKRNALLICFRGGLRSTIAQQWLYEATGNIVPRIAGGYKALRNFLMTQLSAETITPPFLLLGGHTGAGKTLVIRALDNAIDLEAIAVHRGSAFGNYIAAQPSQINFENELARQVIQQTVRGSKAIVLEKESKNIGKSRLPDGFYLKMEASPVVVLEASLEERIYNTWRDYVVDDRAKYIAHYGEHGTEQWANHLRTSILRLNKRLGGDRTAQVVKLFDNAAASTALADHHAWIEYLLVNYYDPTYDYYRSKWADRVIFRGERAAVEQFINDYRSTGS